MKKVLFTLLILIVLGALGYLYWQNMMTQDSLTNFMNKMQQTISGQQTTAPAVETGATMSGAVATGAAPVVGIWGSASETPLVQLVVPAERNVMDITEADMQNGSLMSKFIGETYKAGDGMDSQLSVLNGALAQKYQPEAYAQTVFAITGAGATGMGFIDAALGQTYSIHTLLTKKIAYTGTTNAIVVVQLYGQAIPLNNKLTIYALATGGNVVTASVQIENGGYMDYLWDLCATQYKFNEAATAGTGGAKTIYDQTQSCYEKKILNDKYIQYTVAQKLEKLLATYALK